MILEELFIHKTLELKDELVDVSIGGYGSEAHRISLNSPYGKIFKVLYKQFGDKIKLVDLFKKV